MVSDPYLNPRIFLQVLNSLGVPSKTAIGALGSISGEGGFHLDNHARNPGDGADGSDSIGWGQWNGARAKNLIATAKALGVDPSDPRAQALHIRNELTGAYGKGGNYSGVLAALKKVDDVGAGADIWTRQYEVPAVMNVNERAQRGYKLAQALADPTGTISISPEATSLSGAKLSGELPQIPSDASTRGLGPRGLPGISPLTQVAPVASAKLPAWTQDPSSATPKQPAWAADTSAATPDPAATGQGKPVDEDAALMQQWGIGPAAQVKSGDTTTAATEADNPDALLSQWGLKPGGKVPEPAAVAADTVTPPEGQAWWQGHHGHGGDNPLTGKPIDNATDKGRQVVVGGVRGAKDVLDTVTHGAMNVADEGLNPSNPAGAPSFDPLTMLGKTGLGDWFHGQTQQVQKDDAAARQTYDTEAAKAANPLYGEAGRVGGQIAATAPLLPMRGIVAGADALTGAAPVMQAGIETAAPLANRVASSIVSGGLGGAAFNALTSSAGKGSTLDQMKEGALGGAALGPIGVGVGALGGGINRLLGGQVSPEVARLAEEANRLGIDLRGSQVSNSPFLKKMDQMAEQTPFSVRGGKDPHAIEDQFGRAVSRTFGEDTPNITPDVIARARDRLGQGFEQVAARNTLTVDNQFATELGTTIADARQTLTPDQMHPFENLVQNVISKIDAGGRIDGNVYTQLTRKGSPIDRLQHSGDTAVRQAANDFRNNLDDLFERSAQPGDVDALRALRRQYKSMKTVEDIVEKDPTGRVNPLLLMQKVVNSPGGKERAGDLGTLADIGKQFFKKPADSGTPLGSLILNTLTNPLSIPGRALQLGAASGPMSLIHAGVLSRDYLRQGIINRSLGRNVLNPVNRLMGTQVAPYAQTLVPRTVPPTLQPGPQQTP